MALKALTALFLLAGVVSLDSWMFAKPDDVTFNGLELVKLKGYRGPQPVTVNVRECKPFATKHHLLRYEFESRDCLKGAIVDSRRLAVLPGRATGDQTFIAVLKWNCPDCFRKRISEVTIWPEPRNEKSKRTFKVEPAMWLSRTQELEVSFNIGEQNAVKMPEVK